MDSVPTEGEQQRSERRPDDQRPASAEPPDALPVRRAAWRQLWALMLAPRDDDEADS